MLASDSLVSSSSVADGRLPTARSAPGSSGRMARLSRPDACCSALRSAGSLQSRPFSSGGGQACGLWPCGRSFATLRRKLAGGRSHRSEPAPFKYREYDLVKQQHRVSEAHTRSNALHHLSNAACVGLTLLAAGDDEVSAPPAPSPRPALLACRSPSLPSLRSSRSAHGGPSGIPWGAVSASLTVSRYSEIVAHKVAGAAPPALPCSGTSRRRTPRAAVGAGSGAAEASR
mmetsp:Transcript_7281/g.26820  ORF Transcript_7281/g.26820 Transcript_7281/m.26820 type:complete len:230 (-) Transcript_7281:643-1332(-)